MHSALLAGLASQHAEELRTEAATRRPETTAATAATAAAAAVAGQRPSITQRAGWALIQAGLWLAVHPAGPRPPISGLVRKAGEKPEQT
jgi:hypothetical protein